MMSTNQRSNRRLHWISSITGDPETLAVLDRRMAQFYGEQVSRQSYQTMLDDAAARPLEPHSLASRLLDLIVASDASSVLEVGCGNGWLYKHLRSKGYVGNYHGVEVARYVIDQNTLRFPEGQWHCGVAYQLGLPAESIDTVFAFYVIEHLVYPEKALQEMLRVIRPGGALLLVFPDFVALGHIASQQTGFSPGRSADKLQRGRVWDALVSFFDSRVRIRRMLQTARRRLGSFPINTRPMCLTYPEVMESDVDAVYVASKHEIMDWARQHAFQVDLPFGSEGFYHCHAVVRLIKPIPAA